MQKDFMNNMVSIYYRKIWQLSVMKEIEKGK
jgi:hypothetical protein